MLQPGYAIDMITDPRELSCPTFRRGAFQTLSCRPDQWHDWLKAAAGLMAG